MKLALKADFTARTENVLTTHSKLLQSIMALVFAFGPVLIFRTIGSTIHEAIAHSERSAIAQAFGNSTMCSCHIKTGCLAIG